MTPSSIKELLSNSNLKPNKLMGQNFLVDQNILKKIIETAQLSKKDTVLEVGPGLGILTRELAKSAGRVIAVEKDKEMAKILQQEFAEQKNIKIIEGDIMHFFPLYKRGNEGDLKKRGKILPRPLTPERSDGGRANPSRIHRYSGAGKYGTGSFSKEGEIQNYKLVANIPYYLTSHLIRLFLESANPPQEMILMLQKEVAERICPPQRVRSSGEAGARSPKMSLLAVSVQFYADAEIIAPVSKNSFWPAPKVDSAIIKITPRNIYSVIPTPQNAGGIQKPGSRIPPSLKLWRAGKPGMTTRDTKKLETGEFFRVVRAGFTHPRKQLISNLSQGLKITREEIEKALKSIGVQPQQRAETLNIEDWMKLAKIIY